MWIESPFVRTFTVITGSLVIGYVARRSRLVRESLARWIMTFVAVVGYSIVGFFAIWGTKIAATDLWLPLFLAGGIVAMGMIALGTGRFLTDNRKSLGLFSISSAMGNHGTTMGGFIIFLLYGAEGLGLSTIYTLSFTPMMILVLYPIARYYSGKFEGRSLGMLMLRSLFDWRSIGLVSASVAIVLSVRGVPRPKAIETYHVIAIGMYTINALAYFSIGLRLRLGYVGRVLKPLAGLAVIRFVAGPAICLGLLVLTGLTPWPLEGLRRNIVLIQAIVPMGVTNVAVANMFDLHPREASVLFVVNTLTYLVVVLPVVFWLFG